MTRYQTFGEVPGVPCDTCAETLAAIHLADASLCDDCFETLVGETLEPLFGFTPCATIIWSNNNPAICLTVAGIEHHH